MTRFSHLPRPAELKGFLASKQARGEMRRTILLLAASHRIIPELLLVLRCLGFRGLFRSSDCTSCGAGVLRVGKRESTVEWKEFGIDFHNNGSGVELLIKGHHQARHDTFSPIPSFKTKVGLKVPVVTDTCSRLSH
jgi:hypothetical protein